MNVRFTNQFKKNYKKLDLDSQKAIDKAIYQFLQEKEKPNALRIKKMSGYLNIFEMSANMNIRVTFEYEKPETVIIRNCGYHDKTLKNP